MVAPGDRRVGTFRPCSASPTAPARASSTSTACSPTPPASTPRRGSRCSTTTCAPAPSGTAHRSGRSTSRTTTAPTSTAAPGSTAPAASSSRAASSSPRARPDDPPDAETLWGLSTRKNDLVQEKIRTVGVDVYPGSVRYLQAVKDAGLLTACVSSSANAEQVLEVAGLSDVHRPPGRRGGRQAARPARQARPRHVPRRRGRSRRAPRSRPSSSRTRWPAWRRAVRAASATWSASTASGTPTRCGSTAPTSSCRICGAADVNAARSVAGTSVAAS